MLLALFPFPPYTLLCSAIVAALGSSKRHFVLLVWSDLSNNNRRWWPVEELFVHTTQVFFQQSAQTCGIRKKKMERLPLCPAATRPRIVARCRCRETSLRNGNHHRQTQPQWNKEKESVDRTGKKKCGLQVLLPCLCAPYTFTCPCVCCVCCILLPLQVKKKKN